MVGIKVKYQYLRREKSYDMRRSREVPAKGAWASPSTPGYAWLRLGILGQASISLGMPRPAAKSPGLHRKFRPGPARPATLNWGCFLRVGLIKVKALL